MGQGDGTFQAAPDVAVRAIFGSVTVADFNADGRLDLAVLKNNFGAGTNTVSILLGRGDGTFRAAPDVAVEASPSSVTSAVTVRDFNADGRLDLAVVNTNFGAGAATVSIFLGRGDGTFQAARHFGVDSFASFITVVDFNADGRLDLAVANSNSNTVSILLNTTPAGVVNHLVAFAPLRATQAFTTDRTGCPAGFVGTFRFTARLTNRSMHPLTELGVAVTTLTNDALLQNTVGGPGGVGARLPIPATGGFSDGVLRPAEGVDVPFAVCLRERRPFRFEVDVLGFAAQSGGL